MCIVNCSKQLMASIVTKKVMQGCVGVVRNACLIPKARYHGMFLHRRRHYQSFINHYQSARHTGTKRYYSQLYDECNDSKKTTDEFHEGTGGMERDISCTDHSQQTVEGFTIDVMVSLLRQENAVDICVIKIPEDMKYSDYFIVVSGISTRHIRAMATYAIKVYKFMKKDKDPHAKIEGKDAEDWMCIDFGSMVVHFMLPETRDVYELEKLWTLRSCDEQLKSIPPDTLPEDFIYGVEVTK